LACPSDQSWLGQFNYDGYHQRWKQMAVDAGSTTTTYYVGGILEKVIRPSGVTEYRHMIPAGSGTAIYTRRSDATNSTYYVTTDHLGSGDLVLDSAGAVLARESFTPFGERRGSNWQGLPSAGDKTVFGNVTRRGFTGHEMLDAVNLIHMNGRVYDPHLGRFLSADPIIQTIALSQALNPFSYVMNNPLTLIDPSGYSWLSRAFSKLLKAFGHFMERYFLKIVGVVVSAYTYGAPFWAKLIANSAISTAANGGRVTVSYSWGFGGGGAAPGFGGTTAGPPGASPGINPTPQIPGLMSIGGGISLGDEFNGFITSPSADRKFKPPVRA
jgi:RHS repeat-associated protein